MQEISKLRRNRTPSGATPGSRGEPGPGGWGWAPASASASRQLATWCWRRQRKVSASLNFCSFGFWGFSSPLVACCNVSAAAARPLLLPQSLPLPRPYWLHAFDNVATIDVIGVNPWPGPGGRSSISEGKGRSWQRQVRPGQSQSCKNATRSIAAPSKRARDKDGVFAGLHSTFLAPLFPHSRCQSLSQGLEYEIECFFAIAATGIRRMFEGNLSWPR